jgi:Archaeal transcriptional regulator TrmB.
VLWTTAETLATTAEERPFPRRYASIRRAVKDVRALDGECYATVEGRDTETGESVIVEGRVAAVDFHEDEQVASLHIDTDDGEVTVGGLVAAYEAVEGQAIHLGRESPPDI